MEQSAAVPGQMNGNDTERDTMRPHETYICTHDIYVPFWGGRARWKCWWWAHAVRIHCHDLNYVRVVRALRYVIYVNVYISTSVIIRAVRVAVCACVCACVDGNVLGEYYRWLGLSTRFRGELN